MGKKPLRQVQVKISKTTTCEKKQLVNNLIKVERPKVYITDCSSFKSLVQDLTGNGSNPVSQLLSLPSSSSSSSLPQILQKVVPVEDDHGNPESSMESSFDASLESFQVCNHLALCSTAEEINQAYDPLPFDDTNSSEYNFMNNQQEDSLVYGNLQSLLLDNIDKHHPSLNFYYKNQQEVSIYDYELSGLISKPLLH